jgi:uncharacterized protein YdaU (DUF1376 family)
MTDLPAMLLWTDAYLGDTTHLTTFEHGAYLLILMAMWRSGGELPDDDVRLARVAKTTLDRWRKIAPTIRDFLTAQDGVLTQKRLTHELSRCHQRSQNFSERGRAGGIAKSLKNKRQAVQQLGSKSANQNQNHIDIVLTDLSTPPAVDLLGEPLNPKKKSDPINGHAAAIVDSFVSQWDSIAVSAGLARCRAISDARRKHILARARDLVEAFGYADPIMGFGELFAKIRGSPFLLGRQGDGWKCDLDWVLTESKFLKIMEGKYAPEQRGGSVRSGIAAGSRH